MRNIVLSFALLSLINPVNAEVGFTDLAGPDAPLFSNHEPTGGLNKTAIISGHPEYPPIMWQSGNEIAGVGAKLASHIFSALNIPYRLEFSGPWKRVQLHAQQGYIDVIVAAFKNSERQKYMEYSVPFTVDPIVVFVRKGREFPLEKWEDLIGRLGTTTLGDSMGQEFDDFANAKLNIERTSTVIQNFKKLELERCEYFIYGLYPGTAAAINLGFDDMIVALPYFVTEQNFYLTVSRKSPYLNQLPQINTEIERLKADGSIDRWTQESLNEYRRSSIMLETAMKH